MAEKPEPVLMCADCIERTYDIPVDVTEQAATTILRAFGKVVKFDDIECVCCQRRTTCAKIHPYPKRR